MKIKISLKAYEDLENIHDYTVQNWGVRQAEIYREAIDSKFRLLAHHPEIGRRVEGQPSARRFLVNKHIIIYRITSDAIFIIRIRHSAEDPDTFLP